MLFASITMLLALVAGCGGDGGTVPGTDAGSGMLDAATNGDGGSSATDSGSSGTDAGMSASDAGGAADSGRVSMPCMAAGECDPFVSTPCAAASSCRPTDMGTRCMATSMTLGEGALCDRADQCAPGLLCLDFGDGFQCSRMCPMGSIGFCGATSACTGSIGDACVQVCRPLPPRCDIYAQDCADSADTCTFVRNSETDEPYTGCRPAGTRTRGQTCGGMDGACGHDLVCIRSGETTACHGVCNPEAARSRGSARL